MSENAMILESNQSFSADFVSEDGNLKPCLESFITTQKMTKIMEDCQADTIAKDSSAEEQTANLQLNPLPPLNIQPSSPRPILPTSPFSASSTSSEDWFDFQDHKTDSLVLPSPILIESTIQQAFTSHKSSGHHELITPMSSNNLGKIWNDLSKAQSSTPRRISWCETLYKENLIQAVNLKKPFSLSGDLKSRCIIKLPSTF